MKNKILNRKILYPAIFFFLNSLLISWTDDFGYELNSFWKNLFGESIAKFFRILAIPSAFYLIFYFIKSNSYYTVISNKKFRIVSIVFFLQLLITFASGKHGGIIWKFWSTIFNSDIARIIIIFPGVIGGLFLLVYSINYLIKINFFSNFKQLNPKLKYTLISLFFIIPLSIFYLRRDNESINSSSSVSSCNGNYSFNLGRSYAESQEGLIDARGSSAPCSYLYDLAKTQSDNIDYNCFCEGVNDYRRNK